MKYSTAKFANFVLIYITHGKMHHFRPKVVHFPVRIIQIQNLQISQGYIFLILQHFAAKLCNFTNFNMLFLAVVMDFVPLALIKI